MTPLLAQVFCPRCLSIRNMSPPSRSSNSGLQARRRRGETKPSVHYVSWHMSTEMATRGIAKDKLEQRGEVPKGTHCRPRQPPSVDRLRRQSQTKSCTNLRFLQGV